MFAKSGDQGTRKSQGRRVTQRPTFLRAMWKNGVVRSTVGVGATSALIATMMFGGGGFSPALASPTDQKDFGVEQSLLTAAKASDGVEDMDAKATEAQIEDPISGPEISPEAEKPAEVQIEDPISGPEISPEAEKAAESEPVAPADKEKPKKVEDEKLPVPFKAPIAPVKEGLSDEALVPLTDESAGAPVVMAIPTAPSGGAVINVKLRTLQAGNGTPPSRGSVKLRLRVGTNSGSDKPGAVISESWATCTSDSSGDCSFSLPREQMDKYFWIENLSASTGYYLNDTLITGNNTNASNNDGRFGQTPYAFRTGRITARTSPYAFPSKTNMPANTQVGNQTLDTPINRATTNRWRTNGFWPVSIDNPRYSPTCRPGLKVALVVDLSTSMKTTNDEGLKGARAASKAMFDALARSESGANVDLFTFGNDAPASGQANRTNSFSAMPSEINTFNSRIDALSVSGVQYTNWDAGLEQVAAKNGAYDLSIVLTDGNPTRSRASANSEWTDFAHLENAIFSANAIKAEGTQILTFGVGEGISGVKRGDNLAAVSGLKQWTVNGKIADADYALTNDWTEVAKQLAALAKGVTCQSEITVKKQIRGLDDNLSNGVNWDITGKKTVGSGILAPSGTVATGQDGTARFDLKFTEPAGSGTVNIAETQQAGYAFESAVCKVNGANRQVTQAEAFDLTLAVGDQAECTIVNKMLPPVPVIKKSSDPVSGTEVKPGEAIKYTLSFGNEGHSPLAVDYVDHLANVLDDATFNNDIRITGEGLSAVRGGTNNDQILIKGTVEPNKTVTITYSVKVKTEKFGDGIAKNFVVPKGENPPTVCEPDSELCTEHPIPGKLVTAKSSDPESGSYVEPGSTVKYTLTFKNTGASAIDVNHIDNLSDVLDDATFNAGSLAVGEGLNAKLVGDELRMTGKVPAEKTISVTYTVTINVITVDGSGNGTAANFLIQDGEEPPKVCEPEDPDCTTHPILGSATWVKTDGATKALAGSEWELTGPGVTQPQKVEDCIAKNAADCTGLDRNPAAGKFELGGLKWGEYSLKETKAPAGYVLDSKAHKFTVGDVKPASLINDLGKIKNDQQPALALPLTGGVGSQTFFIGGGAVLLAALALLGWRRRKEVA